MFSMAHCGLRSKRFHCLVLVSRRLYANGSAAPKSSTVPSHHSPNDMRQLLVQIMNTTPSKRELQQFLKRYVPQLPEKSSTPTKPLSSPSMLSSKAYVDALLEPTYLQQLALTKVQGPFDKAGWQAVGSTLCHLQKLGLPSIAVTDSLAWPSHLSTAELIRQMTQESMALVEAIERAGGRARPLHGGVLDLTPRGLGVALDFIEPALEGGQIPVVVPIAFQDGTQHPVRANETLLALTRALVNASDRLSAPTKIVVINREGGIPNHERLGTTHGLINVEEECDAIHAAFAQYPSWKESYPAALDNLRMIRDCLALLPSSSSAVMTPTTALPTSLITNLITDKPLYSTSLPVRTNMDGQPELERVNQTRTTVLRHGTRIRTFKHVRQLDRPRLTALLESSFQRTLDPAFYDRLEDVLACAIVAGDYEGAVLVTREQVDGDAFYYLDKFAIAPTSQGMGLTDILWRRMCDTFPELLWRSRSENGVNRWYFERSNGYLRLKGTQWVLFWHGPQGRCHVDHYARIAKAIPPSFTTTTHTSN